MQWAGWRYPHLYRLWANWLQSGHRHQLDIWLANWFKQHPHYGRQDRRSYADALFAAMHFLALAAALEAAYQGRQFNHKQHPVTQANALPPAAFWYWVLLRLGLNLPPKELADASRRQLFFAHWQTNHAVPHKTDKLLLWHGLHPALAAALAQRQQLSHWSADDYQTFLQRQTATAPLWLRPQQLDANTPSMPLL